MHAEFAAARILVLDDEPVNTLLLGRILAAAGYEDVTLTSDPREAIALYVDRLGGPEPFDLVCTDLHMPHLSGLDVLTSVARATPAGDFVPMVVLTADITAEAEQAALAAGAQDFVTKPFRPEQIRLRIANLLRSRTAHRRLRDHNDRLEALVRERTLELEAARLDILHRLAAAAEYRDVTTGRHTQRVGSLSGMLAARLGCGAETSELVGRAAQLHDVGKIGIPDSILLKPGRLSAAERLVIQDHVEVGARLLSNGTSKLISMAEVIALTHHERWDGSGYPHGLEGAAIPLVGQIVAVADVFDTLVNERPYKPAWPIEDALLEMERLRGRWFAPRLMSAFMRMLDERPDLLEQMRDADTADAPVVAHVASSRG